MFNLTAILRYQETDKKLFDLERDLAASPARKEFVRVKKFLEGAAEKLDALEAKARALKERCAEMEIRCAEAEKELADFSGLDELIEKGGDVSYYKKAAIKQLETVKKAKGDLDSLTEEIQSTDKEYKELKKNVIVKQKEYAEANEKYKQAKAEREDERKACEKELSEISAEIPAETMTKYLAKRKEKVFPVVVKLSAEACPFCGMGVSLVAMNKLKDGVIECESCRRILYKD